MFQSFVHGFVYAVDGPRCFCFCGLLLLCGCLDAVRNGVTANVAQDLLHAILCGIDALDLSPDLVQLIFHSHDQTLACLVRAVAIDQVVQVVEESLQVLDLFRALCRIDRQGANQFEEVEKYGACQGL